MRKLFIILLAMICILSCQAVVFATESVEKSIDIIAGTKSERMDETILFIENSMEKK